jgi:oxygen-independent coproporphyrinogen-3 oxidase
MTSFETSWADPELHIPFLDGARERLHALEQDGLVELQSEGCSVTQLGRTFLRNVCMVLDARLARQTPPEKLFSRAV